MQIVLKRIRNAQKKTSVFVDIEILDLGIYIKGVRVIMGKNGFAIFYPHLKTEEGKPYTPFRFFDPVKHKEFDSFIRAEMFKIFPLKKKPPGCEWKKKPKPVTPVTP